MCLLLPLLSLLALTGQKAARGQQPVSITVDASAPGTPYQATSNWFGADEPNYLTTPGGRALLGELGTLHGGGPVYFRPHNLLTSGNGTPALKWGSTNVYTEDAAGRPVYSWTLTDGIFDAMLGAGVTPFVEIGFTPEALSPHPQPYQHSFPKGDLFTGWSYPPSDDLKWAALIEAWVRHLRGRYGKQVAAWRWEVWNEPDIAYFHGTPEQYFHLYDITAAAVERALPGAQIGGPAVTGPYEKNTFLRAFLEHCARGRNAATGSAGAPLRFISFHPKGSPRVVEGHVEMGIAHQLRAMENGFRTVAAFPQFRTLPIVLSESDPEGCAACTGPANGYRNGEAYSASVLEATARSEELARQYGVNLQGAVNWAFLFPGQPPFAGFRELATSLPGAASPVDKPVLNAFRLLAALGGEQLPVVNLGQTPSEGLMTPGPHTDVMAIATRRRGELDLLVWSYSDALTEAPPTPVTVTVKGLAGAHVRVDRVLLDHEHGNAYTAWQAMGSPARPTPEQEAQLHSAALLHPVNDSQASAPGFPGEERRTRTFPLELERNGAVLLRFHSQ